MLLRSQPLDPRISEKYELRSKGEFEAMTEGNIKSQRVGLMFDDDNKKRKYSLKTLLCWKWRDVKGAFHDCRYVIGNHVKWHKTLKVIRPWEGFDGLLRVMQTHLQHYLICEEKYGSAEEEYKNRKIASVIETLELLERMSEPDGYCLGYTKKLRANIQNTSS